MINFQKIADGIRAIVNAVLYGWNRIRKAPYTVDLGIGILVVVLAFEVLQFRTTTSLGLGVAAGVISMGFDLLPDSTDDS